MSVSITLDEHDVVVMQRGSGGLSSVAIGSANDTLFSFGLSSAPSTPLLWPDGVL
jgi:hypothetical protein